MPQSPGPRGHGSRDPRDVEQLVHEMGPVIEQYAAPPRRTRAAPRRTPSVTPRIRREPVDPELREVPAPDRAFAQPVLHPEPHRIEAVLMTRHHDPVADPGRRGDAVRFGARERHRLLAHDVVAPLEAPQDEIEMRDRRRADVDEVDWSEGD